MAFGRATDQMPYFGGPYAFRPVKLDKIPSTLKMPDDMIVKSKIFKNLYTSE